MLLMLKVVRMLAVYTDDERDWTDGADEPTGRFDPDTPMVEPVFLSLLGGDAHIYYGDYRNDLREILTWKPGRRIRRSYGTDDIERGLDAFEFCEQAAKGLAGSDTRAFDGDVVEFIRWFFSTYEDELTIRTIWKQANAKADRGDISQNDVPAFYRWFLREKKPLKRTVKPKPKPKAGRPASDATLALIESLPKGSDRRVACMIMWQAGLRIAEALALRWCDLAVETGCLYVAHGKGDKARLVPVSPKLEKELTALLRARRENGGATSDDKVLKVSRAALQKWLDRHDGAAHQLRHRAGNDWTAAGLSIDQVALLLGHSSIRTTQRYRHANAQDIGRALGWGGTE
jgi:integrase